MIEVGKLPVQTAVSKKKSLWGRTKDLRIGLLFLAPSILLFSIFLFYPLFRTIYYSFYLTDIHGEANLFVGLENYQYLFSDPAFYKSINSTLLFVLYTVPTSIVFALFLALIANEKVRGIGLFRVLFSSTMGISVAASAVIWLFLFHPSVGLFNNILAAMNLPAIAWLTSPDWALFSVSVTTVWVNTGFAFLVILGGLQNIDTSLYESASIDGASYLYKLRRVTLPMLSPTLFFIVTVTLISAFQSFGQIDILTHGGPNDATNLIVYSIYKEAFVNHQFGTASAQAMVLFVFIFIATLLQFKFAERKVHYK
ncbi:sugar ABC transporter permease [Bacillus toyonensis]|uniref:Sugar ABC transporter permease n=1 Tax=Bacillus toyonensis TaxID=155322 RepID=A0AB36T956_9BACI|nr:sugar ABC transporter permease [Bacillus toyonensis]PKR91504.1 Binding-protein-dependent transport system inner membrane component [Bacillus cereus Rock4-18]PEC11790.1 sugar ABC transporter permease [Bacillus toyonensis]PED94101.1 sugar ABC transporter permease [Bacillus toyonensis]PEL57309.1 sugar ABC transporter permease [Bacillus toyonensis]PEN61034.1 sugar ABC transporter permease [Bacillus toyonensis]